MSKRQRLMFAFLCVLVFLSSCSSTGLFLKLGLCGSYAIPGMFCRDQKGNQADTQVLEEDEEGRILFEYTAPNVITGKIETVLVICQHASEEYVYFYEDQCYLANEYSDADLQAFKERNSWGASLAWDRMSRRPMNISFDLVIISNAAVTGSEALSLCSEVLGLEKENIERWYLLDVDPRGQSIYLVETYHAAQKYLVLLSAEGNHKNMQIFDNALDSLKYAEMKQQGGWQFGY